MWFFLFVCLFVLSPGFRTVLWLLHPKEIALANWSKTVRPGPTEDHHPAGQIWAPLIFYWCSPPKSFSSVQLLSCVWLCNPMDFGTPGFPVHHQLRSLFKLMSIASLMPSNHLFLCRPLLLSPSTFPSIRVFSNESVLCIRWPKYWSFSFSINPSNEYSGLISFRIDRLDLLAVQGTLKSLLQHPSSKASILQHSAFFILQLSHPGMTVGKTMALTRQIFVGKLMSLLFNTLSRMVKTFLPRSKRLLISLY